jgi:hypothetical protein
MAEIIYRYKVGDVLRLCQSNPLIPAGDYVLLQVGDIVTMARLINSSHNQSIAKKRVYLQITDLCLFVEIGSNYHEQIEIPVVKRRTHVEAFQMAAAEH